MILQAIQGPYIQMTNGNYVPDMPPACAARALHLTACLSRAQSPAADIRRAPDRELCDIIHAHVSVNICLSLAAANRADR